ncbi:aminopeptidase N [Methylothermus subterraneus]
MNEATPRPVRLEDYRPPAYLVDRIELDFDLEAATTVVKSRLQLRRNPQTAGAAPLVLDGEELKLQAIRLDGQPLPPDRYRLEPDRLVIPEVPARFELETEVQIHPQANTRLEGLYVSKDLLCTQCEAEGFRRITYFPDRPDVMARFRVTLRADKTRYPVLLSNGNLIAQGDLEDGQHFATWEDPFPKPCYLFALVAGKLAKQTDTYTTASGRNVLLEIYVEPQDLDKCAYAMEALKRAMRWDEEKYGREYDLDRYMIVAVSHFNMGAMENKGLNLFNAQYVLAKPETATDADYDHILAVVGHEYFHNWTGNRITLRDWFQLSLKEGLTVFREQQFAADQGSAGVRRIEDVNLLRTRQFPEDEGPLAHPVRPSVYLEINNFYTLTVYEKGAEVVRMLHTLLGEEGFRRGMDWYFSRHDGQAVTCEDFVQALADANRVDLTQFLRWYTQAGTPKVTVHTAYDPLTKTFALTLRQSCPPTPGQPHKEPFVIPIRLGLLGQDGWELPLKLQGERAPGGTCRVLALTQIEQTFVFEDVPEPPIVSLLRGFSAPVKLDYPRPRAELDFLWRHDPDPFVRWDAAQTLISDLLLEQLKGARFQLDSRLKEGFRALLTEPLEDLSYTALLLTLPEEDYLAEQLPVIDVDGVHRVREEAKQALAEALAEAFWGGYRRHHRPEEAYDLSSAAIGRRRLKNVCLEYLACLGTDAARAQVLEQFDKACNLTDQLAALKIIAHTPHPHQSECLERFYRRWREEPLVIDKWFAVQATSPLPGGLERVKALLSHPDFDLRYPNRVRAVLGAFAQRNPIHFHRADGAGYRLLTEHLIALDRLNPQLAARLAQPLAAWRRHDSTRQQHMRAELTRLLNTPGLSKDLFEIASKALAVT